jgi:UDP-N-acetylglucosamine 4,6-dehydratase
MILDEKVVLITGGTGSFGKEFTKIAFQRFRPKKLIIFSRDEYKQFQMQKLFPPGKYPVRYFIGDIRDKERLYRALDGVDYIVHAAALKQVPAAEYNPFEAVKTNILGAQNIVEAAIDRGVKKVVALSTDKAVSPVNLYGATKLAMEKLIVAANVYVGTRDTVLSVVRYGNVVGSRGSVIPLFLDLLAAGEKEIPLTDERMTRFWITLAQGVDFVLTALEESVGGEIFVPKIPSMKIVDLARAMCRDCRFKIIGIRPGEKIHESLISEDEGRTTAILKKDGSEIFVILPQYAFETKGMDKYRALPRVPEGFAYKSNTNDCWLTVEELKELLNDVQPE